MLHLKNNPLLLCIYSIIFTGFQRLKLFMNGVSGVSIFS